MKAIPLYECFAGFGVAHIDLNLKAVGLAIRKKNSHYRRVCIRFVRFEILTVSNTLIL